MIVTKKGEANNTQSSRAGIYTLGPDTVNGKSHWLQNPGVHAIWFSGTNWNIAPKEYLGSTTAHISSTEDVAGPQEVKAWQYFDEKWIKSDDILVDTFVEPGT